MRRWTVIIFLTGALLLPSPSRATPDPWSPIFLDDYNLVIGQEVRIRMNVLWASATDGGPPSQNEVSYYAYLLPSSRKEEKTRFSYLMPDWEERAHEAILLAPLRLENFTFGGIEASAAFRVPAVSTGHYLLAFCSFGCDEGMGAAWPTSIRIFANRGHARAVAKVGELRQRISRLARAHRQDKEALRRAVEQRDVLLDALQMRLSDIRGRLSEVFTMIQELPAQFPVAEKDSPMPYLLAGGALGVGGSLIVAGASRRRATV